MEIFNCPPRLTAVIDFHLIWSLKKYTYIYIENLEPIFHWVVTVLLNLNFWAPTIKVKSSPESVKHFRWTFKLDIPLLTQDIILGTLIIAQHLASLPFIVYRSIYVYLWKTHFEDFFLFESRWGRVWGGMRFRKNHFFWAFFPFFSHKMVIISRVYYPLNY